MLRLVNKLLEHSAILRQPYNLPLTPQWCDCYKNFVTEQSYGTLFEIKSKWKKIHSFFPELLIPDIAYPVTLLSSFSKAPPGLQPTFTGRSSGHSLGNLRAADFSLSFFKQTWDIHPFSRLYFIYSFFPSLFFFCALRKDMSLNVATCTGQCIGFRTNLGYCVHLQASKQQFRHFPSIVNVISLNGSGTMGTSRVETRLAEIAYKMTAQR